MSSPITGLGHINKRGAYTVPHKCVPVYRTEEVSRDTRPEGRLGGRILKYILEVSVWAFVLAVKNCLELLMNTSKQQQIGGSS
jgi:hypothetical protein